MDCDIADRATSFERNRSRVAAAGRVAQKPAKQPWKPDSSTRFRLNHSGVFLVASHHGGAERTRFGPGEATDGATECAILVVR